MILTRVPTLFGLMLAVALAGVACGGDDSADAPPAGAVDAGPVTTSLVRASAEQAASTCPAAADVSVAMASDWTENAGGGDGWCGYSPADGSDAFVTIITEDPALLALDAIDLDIELVDGYGDGAYRWLSPQGGSAKFGVYRGTRVDTVDVYVSESARAAVGDPSAAQAQAIYDLFAGVGG